MKNQGQVHIPGAETLLKSHDLDCLEMFAVICVCYYPVQVSETSR